MPEYPYNGVMTPLLPAFSNFTIYDLSVDPFENENLLGKLPPETFIELVTKFFVRSTFSRFRHSIIPIPIYQYVRKTTFYNILSYIYIF